jgi:tetratricopeptide (TPR) repeat protein
MRYWFSLAAIVTSFAVTPLQAQIFGGMKGAGAGNVHIHVVYANDRNAGPYLTVKLMEGSSDTMVGVSFTNDIGEVDFIGVPIGDYHVTISGDGIETTDSPTFEVDNRKVTQAQYVSVRQVEESGPRPVSAHSTVSAAELGVPAKARKEVDKANECMAEQNYKKALEHLNKALALAPQYATAYNNLGVLYARMNDMPHEEEALKKAVAVDDHFAPALVNYGKLSLQQKNFPQAETLLAKAAGVEPNNVETLLLLADAQYMDRHFGDAITSADQAHSASREHPSFVHYIAARAYQQEGKQQEALSEFQLFLKEEPKGPRADHVRGDIAKIEANSTQRAAQ